MTAPPCNCTHAGWCCRLGLEMSPELFDRCRTDDAWRAEREAYIAAQVQAQPPPQPGPGLLQKAINFAGAVVEHVAGGLRQVTPEQHAVRMAGCAPCDWYFQGKCLGSGPHLGCGCNVAAKAWWAEQGCPHRDPDGAPSPRWLPIVQG